MRLCACVCRQGNQPFRLVASYLHVRLVKLDPFMLICCASYVKTSLKTSPSFLKHLNDSIVMSFFQITLCHLCAILVFPPTYLPQHGTPEVTSALVELAILEKMTQSICNIATVSGQILIHLRIVPLSKKNHLKHCIIVEKT